VICGEVMDLVLIGEKPCSISITTLSSFDYRGFMTVGTGIGGHVSNYIFGHTYDLHMGHSCKEGNLCYADSFIYTSAVSIVAVLLSILLNKRIKG
jgi:hypothetical protein